MLATFLLGAAILQDQSPRLRTLLDNGSAIIVENLPDAKTLSVQLIAAARGCEETAKTNGWRHLLEHLILKGKDGQLDRRMESQGIVFTGRTYRDAMQIEFSGQQSQLQVMLEGLREVISPRNWPVEELTKESHILEQEAAVLPASLRLARAGWKGAFPEEGLDPAGSAEAIAKATPSDIEGLAARQFTPDNLVISIAGKVDIDRATSLAKPLLEGLKGKAETSLGRKASGSVRVECNDAFGECIGAAISSYRDRETVAALAFGLATANEFPGSFFIYTPSAQPGIMFVGQTEENSGILQFIDSRSSADLGEMFPLGKLLAQRWLSGYLSSSGSDAFLRGLLLSQGAGYKPEEMASQIEQLTFSDFERATAKFRTGHNIIVVGNRR